MKIKALMVSAACVTLLAACGSGDGSPSRPDPERYAGTGEIGVIPIAEQRFSGDVQLMVYDPSTDTLAILGDPFDSNDPFDPDDPFDREGNFERVPEKDVRGFAAFENPQGVRRYTALVRTDPDTGLSAGVVGTPFRLDSEFGGTMLAREATTTRPENTELTYRGDYAGVRNVGINVGADDSNSFLYRIEGQVRIDIDYFLDSPDVEGVIFDRRSMDQTVEIDGDLRSVEYADVVLRSTSRSGGTFDADGFFEGAARINQSNVGRYVGYTSGDDAAAVAGVIDIVDGGERERGAFIAHSE